MGYYQLLEYLCRHNYGMVGYWIALWTMGERMLTAWNLATIYRTLCVDTFWMRAMGSFEAVRRQS